MESIMARALEYTLKYWLKSFSRDQFKLQGRTVQLSNLDISGDALHASLGLPPALTVSMAKSGKLEIVLPYLSNVQLEPIIVQIDKLDVVLEENDESTSRDTQTPSSSSKGSGYGFAEKIADGMTLNIQTVNLLLDIHGGARHLEGATWASPMASITIRNLGLYTTNENWQVVNLKAARDFSSNKKFIYVFRKLEWEYMCIDLLPHPDILANASERASSPKEDDGAKRAFFGGERCIDGLSGEAYITIQRTDLNKPLGLELQVHVTEAICQALSEQGLRALLRFFSGVYVCLNREDVNPQVQEQSTEAAGQTLVSFMVDHIFLGIKDAGIQLELLMQSLHFSRASVSDGTSTKYLTRFIVGGLILRDTFSRPPCPLLQPSMDDLEEEHPQIPDFGKNFCPPIYPLGEQQWGLSDRVPLMSLHSLKFMPSVAPPSFSSQTVIDCKPLTIHLQEESCLRLSSYVADGVVINVSDISSDIPISSLHIPISSLQFSMKKLDITFPLETRKDSPFRGTRLHIENLNVSESPSLRVGLLNLDMDAACFCMWEGQPIDASQKKWTANASLLGLSLDTSNNANEPNGSRSDLWRCIEIKDVSVQAAMVTSEGSPLRIIPPPGGVVRVGAVCEQFVSNTSVEQLFFVLDLYAYIDNVSDKIAMGGKNKHMNTVQKDSSDHKSFREKVPADTAISIVFKNLKLTFLESSSVDIMGTPLVQFIGDDLSLQVTHRTLGAAMAISSTLRWDKVQVDCAANVVAPSGPELRTVFWVQNMKNIRSNGNVVLIPFLNLSMVHVVPYDATDTKCHSLRVLACIAGVRLAGGMNYNESLLQRFGILGIDDRPGAGLSRGLERFSSGPLSKLFKESPPFVDEVRESQNESIGDEKNSSCLQLSSANDVFILLELKDWLFSLESADEMEERHSFNDLEDPLREGRSWHTSFETFKVKANGNKTDTVNTERNKYPIEVVKVGIEGLKTLKPQQKGNAPTKSVEPHSGIDLEVDIAPSQDIDVNGMFTWAVEHLKVSAKQPIEVIVRKDELQHAAHLCKLEIDSMGRIAVGILRLFNLDRSFGQAALDQLSRLGSEGLEEIFSPRNQSTPNKRPSVDCGQSSLAPPDNQPSPSSSLNITLDSLETALLDSQSNCATLSARLDTSDSSNPHVHNVQELTQKLESMHTLLMKLRSQL